jgi:hypothetical protein
MSLVHGIRSLKSNVFRKERSETHGRTPMKRFVTRLFTVRLDLLPLFGKGVSTDQVVSGRRKRRGNLGAVFLW